MSEPTLGRGFDGWSTFASTGGRSRTSTTSLGRGPFVKGLNGWRPNLLFPSSRWARGDYRKQRLSARAVHDTTTPIFSVTLKIISKCYFDENLIAVVVESSAVVLIVELINLGIQIRQSFSQAPHSVIVASKIP